jgi:hypothetical protein
MKTKDIVRAINYLAPGAEFTFEDNDLDTLIWLDSSVKQPTKAAILAAIPKANAEIEDAKTEAKQDILSRLGITQEEVSILLS